VVFDCDGVLVDSEPHSRRAWAIVLSEIGHPASEEDVAACTGLGYLPTRAALERLGPLPEAAALWERLVMALAQSFASSGLAVFPDAMAALDAVRAARIPVGVASSSPRERLDLTIQAADLSDQFDVSVAGDEVASGKPAPDVYRRALAGLDCPPRGAVAVEDSVAGVLSAQAAGMNVVALVREEAARAGLLATKAVVADSLELFHVGL
jgi:HAD superfamily hydrolase (TIGR01509 family)